MFAVLESICSLNFAMDEETSFNNYSTIISNFLVNKAIQLIKELQHRKVETIRLLEKNLTITSALIHTLIYQLIISFTYNGLETSLWQLPSVPFDSIIKHCEEWLVISRIFNSNTSSQKLTLKNKQSISKPSGVNTLISNVSKILHNIENSILNDTIILKDLNIISSQIDSFLDLLEEFNINSLVPVRITRRLLEYHSGYLQKFNNVLECMQVYSSFFCSMGVRCEQNDIKLIIDNLRNNYDNIKLNMIENSFKDIIISIPEVCWLYELRTSELFLESWRRIGRQICMESLSNSNSYSNIANDDTSTEFFALSAMFEGEEQENVDNEDIVIDELNLTEEERIQLNIQKFELQNSKKLLKTQINEVILTQDIIVNSLIVRIRSQWMELSYEIFTGVISIKKLELTFGNITNESQIKEELRLLALSQSDPSLGF